MNDSTLSLLVRRVVRATPQEVWRAWTRPEVLVQWWGPEGVTCTGAEMDVCVGGEYRIGNETPDGNTVWISGTFTAVEPPRKLAFSWHVDGLDAPSHVTVCLVDHNDGTEVVLSHERIANEEIAEDHEMGWNGCLDGLRELVGASGGMGGSAG